MDVEKQKQAECEPLGENLNNDGQVTTKTAKNRLVKKFKVV